MLLARGREEERRDSEPGGCPGVAGAAGRPGRPREMSRHGRRVRAIRASPSGPREADVTLAFLPSDTGAVGGF